MRSSTMKSLAVLTAVGLLCAPMASGVGLAASRTQVRTAAPPAASVIVRRGAKASWVNRLRVVRDRITEPVDALPSTPHAAKRAKLAKRINSMPAKFAGLVGTSALISYQASHALAAAGHPSLAWVSWSLPMVVGLATAFWAVFVLEERLYKHDSSGEK
jgi:hypothetical protein